MVTSSAPASARGCVSGALGGAALNYTFRWLGAARGVVTVTRFTSPEGAALIEGAGAVRAGSSVALSGEVSGEPLYVLENHGRLTRRSG